MTTKHTQIPPLLDADVEGKEVTAVLQEWAKNNAKIHEIRYEEPEPGTVWVLPPGTWARAVKEAKRRKATPT